MQFKKRIDHWKSLEQYRVTSWPCFGKMHKASMGENKVELELEDWVRFPDWENVWRAWQAKRTAQAKNGILSKNMGTRFPVMFKKQ